MTGSTVSNPSAWATPAVPDESKSNTHPPPPRVSHSSPILLSAPISSLAFAETRLALARILYNFDVEGLPSTRDWANQQKAYLLWDKKPFWAFLKPVR